MADFGERIAVLENKIDKLEDFTEKTYDLSFSIKERLDKQNGFLPHLAEDVLKIKEQQYEMLNMFNNDKIKQTEASIKLKVVWSIIGSVGVRYFYDNFRVDKVLY